MEKSSQSKLLVVLLLFVFVIWINIIIMVINYIYPPVTGAVAAVFDPELFKILEHKALIREKNVNHFYRVIKRAKKQSRSFVFPDKVYNPFKRFKIDDDLKTAEKEKPAAKEAEPALEKKLVCSGIITGKKVPIALIYDKEKNKTYIVKQGDQVGELTVKKITDKNVVLETDKGDVTLTLK